GELPKQRSEPVVEIELVRCAEHDEAVDPFELRDQGRRLWLLRVALERRPLPRPRLERPEGADERTHRDRAQKKDVDPREERPPARDRDDEHEQDRRRQCDSRRGPDRTPFHAASATSAAARSAWRLSIASIASSFIDALTSCGLKRARSNSAVSFLAAGPPPVTSARTRP